jgi:hypothetical protein
MDTTEKILSKMGYLRNEHSINIQDTLNFLKLWDLISKAQLHSDINKQNKTSSMERKIRKSMDILEDKLDIDLS